MGDSLTLRLRLVLGTVVDLVEEEAATGGRRVFLARGKQDPAGGPATRRLILHPAPPDGPTREALHHRADLLLVLTHPSVAAPLNTGEFEGRGWVVDPIPAGIALSARLAARGALSLRESIATLREVARALAALHRRGVSHGDLSAAVVLLDARGTVLTGFGSRCSGSVADDLRALGDLGWEMLVGPGVPAGNGRSLRSHRPSAPVELERLIDGLRGGGEFPRPAKVSEVLAVLDQFPTLAPAAIAEFLDGMGGGHRRTSRSSGWMVEVAGMMGGLIGRLRATRQASLPLFCLFGLSAILP